MLNSSLHFLNRPGYGIALGLVLCPVALFAFDFVPLKTPADVYARVKAGLDVNTRRDDGYTLLHHAATFHDGALIRLLVEKGADMYARDSTGETPFAASISSRSYESMKGFLAAGFDPNRKLKRAYAPEMSHFQYYLQKDYHLNEPIFQIFLKSKADIEQKDSDGRTSLILAAGLEHNRLATARALLKAGATLDARDNRGQTALMAAAIGSRIEIIQLLTQRGASVSQKNKKGVSPLMQSIINKSYDVIPLLLKYEKDLNQLDQYGSTMLHSAVMNQEYELARIYLQAGADPDARDKWGKTAREVAAREGDGKMQAILDGK